MGMDHEAESRDRRLLAPCGLYCGVCGVYIATRDGNEKFKAILGKLYGSEPEKTACKGRAGRAALRFLPPVPDPELRAGESILLVPPVR